ncbi:MAG: hypothetical protein Fur0022_16570 [Anaerolineales bacterium]
MWAYSSVDRHPHPNRNGHIYLHPNAHRNGNLHPHAYFHFNGYPTETPTPTITPTPTATPVILTLPEQVDQKSWQHSGRPQLSGTVRFVDTEHFRIFYTLAGEDAVQLQDDNGNAIPDYVEEMGLALEKSWDIQIEQLGWTAPPPDGEVGGDDRYDIYLEDSEEPLYWLWEATATWVETLVYPQYGTNFDFQFQQFTVALLLRDFAFDLDYPTVRLEGSMDRHGSFNPTDGIGQTGADFVKVEIEGIVTLDLWKINDGWLWVFGKIAQRHFSFK